MKVTVSHLKLKFKDFRKIVFWMPPLTANSLFGSTSFRRKTFGQLAFGYSTFWRRTFDQQTFDKQVVALQTIGQQTFWRKIVGWYTGWHFVNWSTFNCQKVIVLVGQLFVGQMVFDQNAWSHLFFAAYSKKTVWHFEIRA
jgi:hypothetical protein